MRCVDRFSIFGISAVVLLTMGGCRSEDGETADAGGDTEGDGETDDGGDDGAQTLECEAFPLPDVTAGSCEVTTPGNGGVLLRGTVLGENGILRGAEVLVRSDGRISCVDCDCSGGDGRDGVTEINCGDAVISPALINPHDHLGFVNNAPIGMGPDRYEHRHDWGEGQNGYERLRFDAGANADEVLAAELRFVMGGATAVAGVGGEPGLLRNLDDRDLREGLTGPFADSDTFPLDDNGEQQMAQSCDYGGSPTTASQIAGHAYLPHVGEGINAAAANEFRCTSSSGPNNLIGAETAVVHGIALVPGDYAEMTQAGATLVWSPRSNIVLYGNTAPVTAMDTVGLPIAIGTDWVISGSMNMLRELQCADSLDRDYFGDHFSDRAQWQMATSNAARATGEGDTLGTLALGYVGDIAVFRATAESTDYRAVIDANEEDVILVLRGGVALYGDDALLASDGVGGADCETLEVCGVAKRACVAQDTGGSATLDGVRSAIEASYPLFFCGEPDEEPSCEPYRPGEYAGRTDSDGDGDGVADSEDICPTVFDPIRPLESDQGDADEDGAGDACDPCPLDPTDQCAS